MRECRLTADGEAHHRRPRGRPRGRRPNEGLDPVPLMHGPREHHQPDRLVMPDFRRWRPLTQMEAERRRWLLGQMTHAGPRSITGWRREHVASSQGWTCADPFSCCPLMGTQFLLHADGRGCVYEIDHITPWHTHPDSSRPNLQALCPTCHAMKTHAEGGRLA